jgi:hypothetical protein
MDCGFPSVILTQCLMDQQRRIHVQSIRDIWVPLESH